MRSLILSFFLVCLLPSLATAQYKKDVLQLQTDSLLTSLRQQGIDTLCVYESYCVGCVGTRIDNSSPCRTKGILVPTYILWKQAGHSYGRKLDNCRVGNSKELTTTTFWPYFLAHRQQIKKERIKQFVNPSHGAVASFDFYTQQDTVSQYFRPINLIRRLRHSAKKNHYYRYNIHTHTAELWKLLEAVVTTDFTEPK